MAEPAAGGEGVVCQVCGEERAEEERVACARCGTPHHLECWRFVGHCSTFACGSHRYEVGGGAVGSAEPLRISDDASHTDPQLYIDARGRARGREGGEVRPVPVPGEGPAVGPVHGVEGELVELDEPRAHLDVDTPFESALQWTVAGIAFLGFGVSFPKHGPADPALFFRFTTAACVVAALRFLVQYTYVLDNPRREVLFLRRILGFTTEYRVGDFEDVREVGVVGREKRSKHTRWWEYAVVMRLQGQAQIEVSPETRDLAMANGFAEHLADHFGARFRRGRRDEVNLGEGRDPTLFPLVARWDGPLRVLGRVRWTWAILFFLLGAVELFLLATL